MMAITRGLLPLVVIMSVGTVSSAGTDLPEPIPQAPTATRAPVPPPAVLTESRLERYAPCRETLDPIAIQAVLEAHGRMVRRLEAAAGGMLNPRTNPLRDTPLPIYGAALVEWLADDGRGEFVVAGGDPFMEASSSSPEASPAAAELQRQAARCGLGRAAAYWETTRRIASVLDYEPERERFRQGSKEAAASRARGGRAKRFEDLMVTTSAQEIAAESALLRRFLGRLGLCTQSQPAGAAPSARTVCWHGMAFTGDPCPADLNRGSTGYHERDGICLAPDGRPAGPRLRTVCASAHEIRRDLPAYPVACEGGEWVHVLPCANDSACHPTWYANPRSCQQGVCYSRGANAGPIRR